MSKELVSLLSEELVKAEKAEKRLQTSFGKAKVIFNEKQNYSDEQLEVLESLTSRFARLSDILIKKVFRLLEKLDLDDSKTVRDCLILAEKKDLISSYEKFFRIRELRNFTAHEYEDENLFAVLSEILELTPVLFDSLERVKKYSAKFL
jgi:hypothetical protein